MIVLDTNQLEHVQPPDGALLTMLKTIARESGQELCIPEMAVEEYLAHYRHNVQQAQDTLRSGSRDLARLVQFWVEPIAPDLVDQAVRARRQQMNEIFDRVLPTAEGACKEGMLRETRRQAPAKRSWDQPGSGGRDVAIWLTAVEACRSSAEPTYFVSMDTDAFGKGSLRPELLADLEVLGDAQTSFHFCYGVDALLAQLAEKVRHSLDRRSIPAAVPVRSAVQASLTDSQVFIELVTAVGLTNYAVSSSGRVHDLKFLNLQKMAGVAL